ncbi:AraC family transcriptional regulator [Pseudoclostridium thermosuccinogenes]|jgi:AraC-like DNA-binding protein|nr:AraC family transcriptional regulator [Pseudoclostridium thermosuccinogenes]
MSKTIFPLITEEEKKLPFFVTSVGISENQDHMVRPSGCGDYHWLHCVKGSGMLKIDGGEHLISENTGFFFYPRIPHEYYPLEEPWETHWLTFNGYAVHELMELLKLTDWEVFSLSDIQAVENLMEGIYVSLQSSKAVKGFETSVLLYKFLIEVKNHIDPVNSTNKYPKYNQLQPVISYMEQNYSKDITLKELSELIDITPYHLCRIFKQTFNMRPFTYLTRLRVQKAKEMMLESVHEPIREIGKRAGYNDASYFCSIFKEHEGLTPSEFRRMHGNGQG